MNGAISDILNTTVDMLPATSGLTIKRLKAIGINTWEDLLNYFPFRFEDYSLISKISKIQPGEIVTVQGSIKKAKQEFTRKGWRIQKITIADETGELLLIWYNQPYIMRIFTIGNSVSVAGEVKQYLNTLIIEPKDYEILGLKFTDTLHTGKLVPIYPESRGLSSRTLREKLHIVLNHLSQHDQFVNTVFEWLPEKIRVYNQLTDEFSAYQQIHSPESKKQIEQAKNRLGFDELFLTQLSGAIIKKQWKKETVTHGFTISPDFMAKISHFQSSLPFILTNAQKKVIEEIVRDLQKTTPMNRFLQGDVGSGKTIVAAVAAYVAYLNGYQTLVMAPTEILASQHYATLNNLFRNLAVKIALQTGAVKSIKTKTTSEKFDIIIGTHALITKKLQFPKIGLVVIDEQHRFGVAQRAALKQKGLNPHLLTMTATPIPRTVMLTLHNELDLSVLDEMPKDRIPVKTFFTPPYKRIAAYEWIKTKITREKDQVFIICPLIEESEVETMQTVKAAKKEYQHLQNNIFSKFNIALLHGKLKAKEKNQIMADFKAKKYDILVSTSVVEVGIDVPNATIMLIEGAERFGLAQLHQLRGRVGRGQKQSYCLLFTSSNQNSNYKRLEYFAKIKTGFLLAEYDLKIRGPGQIFGYRQHGYDDLKIAQMSDLTLIQKTKNAVHFLLKNFSLESVPKVQTKLKKFTITQVARD